MGITSIDPHRRYRELIGAYALGHLDSARRETIEAHLEGCPGCRSELAELSSVAAVLPLADPTRIKTGASPAAPPLHLVEKVEDRVGRARRGRMYRLAAGLAATAAAALAVLFLSPFSASLKDPTVEQVDFRRLSGQEDEPAFENVAATAALEEEGWGTRINLDASGLLAGETYAVWLEGEDGERAPAGTFQAEDEEEIDLVLGAAMPAGDAVALGLGTPSGETFLQANLKLKEDAVGTLAVPDLRDKSPEEARELAGPDFEIGTGGDAEEPGATVAEQDPAPGERLPKGAEIYLKIETPDEKEVPGVEGFAQETAEEELEEDGFEVEVEYRESSPEEAGKVLDQDPAGDDEAERGSDVLIVIGTGTGAGAGSAEGRSRGAAASPASAAAGGTSRTDGARTGAGAPRSPSGTGGGVRPGGASVTPDASRSTPGNSGGVAPSSPSPAPTAPVPVTLVPVTPASPAPDTGAAPVPYSILPEPVPVSGAAPAPGSALPEPVPVSGATPEPEDVPAVPVPVAPMPPAPAPPAPAPPDPAQEEAPEPEDAPPVQAVPPAAPAPTTPAPTPASPTPEEPPETESPEPDEEQEPSDDR